MSQQTAYTEQAARAPAGADPHAGEPKVVDPSARLIVLTWVTFGIVAWVLHRYAWKPILAGLAQREDKIRAALGQAEAATAKLAEIEAQSRKAVAEAENQSREILSAARATAESLRISLERQARADAEAILTDARTEIRVAVETARAQLKKDSAELACRIAEKVIREELNRDRDRRIAEAYLEQITT